MNATELWQLSPEQFNEWRRANDYPLIWDLLVASLPHFDDWMTEQKIDKQVIFQIGIARFISSRCVLSLCLYMSDDKIRLYETASSALESLRKSGLIRSETRFEPYCMWLAGKHGKDEVKRVQSLLSVSENNKGEAQVLGKHRLLNIGGQCAGVTAHQLGLSRVQTRIHKEALRSLFAFLAVSYSVISRSRSISGPCG